jgi:hypothetical protein
MRDRASWFPHSNRKKWAMKLHMYLNYGGNCAQAFRFYEKHLGGTNYHDDAPWRAA